MRLKDWNELPDFLKCPEVAKYYRVLSKHKIWLAGKRVTDIVIASVMLLFLAIPMAVIAVLIKLDSRGPVFFRQERVTQYGRIFRIYKFRTMVVGASELGAQVTTEHDPRITRIGAKIRHLRMDEFPQVFNILLGDMTLVGTRPEVPDYVKEYTPKMRATLLLPAGLTSRASIAYKDEDAILGQASDPDYVYIHKVLPQKMKYNLASLKKFSFLSDMSVIWDTYISVTGKNED